MVIKDKQELINRIVDCILDDKFQTAIFVSAHVTDDESAFLFNHFATNILEVPALIESADNFFALRAVDDGD